MKKTMNMKKTFAALLTASAVASAASVAENQELLESKVDSINAKRGLELSGSIRAVAQSSALSTEMDPSAKNKLPEVEKDEFVEADLNFGFRPFENVRANMTLRLGAGMQEYFAAAAKTISVPWIDVQGNLGNSFHWIVGDFRQQYSPLTLFMPGVDIMYEPQIFARQRYMAQQQQMLDGNQRNLQGVNLQFRKDLGGVPGELRAEGIFARLNRTAVLDLTGAEGDILPGDTTLGASQASNMDKWMASANLEWLPLNKSAYVGATAMYIFDNEDSYSYTYRHPGYVTSNPYELQSINPYDIDPQKTMVASVRVGGDIAGILSQKNFMFDMMAEIAFSSDDAYTPDSSWALEYDEETNLPTGNFATNDDGEFYKVRTGSTMQTLNGMALLVDANVGYKADSWGVKLALDVVYNDSNWFNNLAQSSSFFAQRILNSDKDGQTVKYGVHSPLYSSFDALYSFSPKFSPVATTMGTDDNAFKGSDHESYSIANYNKNSWTTNVFTRSQLALLETLSDPALQLSLPNGLATSNRLGGRGVVTANVKDFAEVQAMASFFQHVSPLGIPSVDGMGNPISFNYKPATFLEFGAGAKVDVFKIIGISKPLEISGSYKHSERSMETDNWAALGGVDGTSELKSDFINAGLYVQYLPRLGVNLGFQMINTEFSEFAQQQSSNIAPLMSGSQMQWMIGLDYNIAEHAWLAINYGMISVSNEYNTSKVVAATSAEGAHTLPDYYDVKNDVTGTYKHEFSQSIFEASLNVEF
ncbi:MAG: hypothetical protein MJZ05_07785 [Fibrobacter sp.]|nr:hypothetical protein [Fibrobacter sp.]